MGVLYGLLRVTLRPFVEVCSPVCGDGILITPMEECDDMNTQSNP